MKKIKTIFISFFFLILSSVSEKLYEIENSQTVLKISNLEKEVFLFFNISHYKLNQEGVITFKIPEEKPHQILVIEESCSVDEIMTKMPKETDKNIFIPIKSSYKDFEHVFFCKNKDKTTDFILVKIIFDSSVPDIITAVAANEYAYSRIFAANAAFSIVLPNFIPHIIKYSIEPDIDRMRAFAFSTTSKYLTGMNGNFLDKNLKFQVNSERTNSPIFTTSFDNLLNEDKNISLFFFGEVDPQKDQSEEVTTSVEYFLNNINDQILMQIKDTRPKDITIPVQLVNAFDSFYFIGIYSKEEKSKGKIYLEPLTDGIDFYYKGELPKTWKNIKDIFPGPKNGEEVLNSYIIPVKSIDLITAKCKTMCMFNIHFISEETLEKKTIKPGEELYIDINQNGNTFKLDTTSLEEGKKFYLIITNINGFDTEYEANGKKELITKTKKTLRKEEIQTTSGFEFTLKTTNLNEAFLHLSIIEDGLFQIVEDYSKFSVNNKHLALLLPKNKNYFLCKIDFLINGLEVPFKFLLQKTEKNYFILPKTSTKASTKFTKEIVNPYYNIKSIPESEIENYYLIFSFEDYELKGVTSKVLFKENPVTQILKKNQNFLIDTPGKFILEQSPDTNKKLVIFATKCLEPELDFYIQFNNIILTRNYIEANGYYFTMDTKMYQLTIEFTKAFKKDDFSQAMFYYTFFDENTINKYKLLDTLKIKSSSFGHFSWKSPFAETTEEIEVEYKIYLGSNHTDTPRNACLIEPIPQSEFKKSKDKNVSMKVQLNKNVNSYVYVTGQPTGDFNPIITYDYYVIEKSSWSKSTIIIIFCLIFLIAVLSIIIIILIKKINLKSSSFSKDKIQEYSPLSDNN